MPPGALPGELKPSGSSLPCRTCVRPLPLEAQAKDLKAAGASIPADTYGNRAERVAEAEDQDAAKADEPGTGARMVSGMNSGGEERPVSDEPPERNLNPRE